MIRHALLLTLTLLAAAPVRQTVPTFGGQWQLVAPASSSGHPLELLVIGPTASRFIHVDRRFADGVTELTAQVTLVGPTMTVRDRDDGAAVIGGSLSQRQEVWSLDTPDLLRIDVTVPMSSGEPARTQLLYRRMPAPTLRLEENLLENANASQGHVAWVAHGSSVVEACDGNPCFAVRNHGSFTQTVLLPPEAAGHFLVMIGSGSSERIEPNAITGLPYLYGMPSNADGSRFLSYFQGQGMLGRPDRPGQWMTMSGVFAIPAGTSTVSIQLNQGEGRGVPQNGSAARFDDLGCFIFASEASAKAFVTKWLGRR